MNATFPIITMDGFRSKFNMKMESGEDSKPAKKRAKGGDAYDDPYDFDHLKPPLQEFTPDDNGRVAGSLATYVGLRRNSAGREAPFSEDVKRWQATWPFSQQLMGALVNQDSKEIHDVFRRENIHIGLFPQMRHWPLSSLYGKAHEWKRGENCKLYCLSAYLMADMFRQLPQLLLEGVAWKTTEGSQPVSEVTAM